jgi:hypothetical protein
LLVDKFREQVPLTDYPIYDAAIDQITSNGTSPLTTQPVDLLEPTSGTSAGEKLIPYTRALRAEFRRAVAVWIDDLFTRRPRVMRGRAYWSVSPPLSHRRRTPSGIPIGFDDDTAYLGFWSRGIVKRLLAVPPQVAQMTGADAWKYATLWYLLLAEDLTLVSVWSPTFVTELTRSLTDTWRASLARDLSDGECRCPHSGAMPLMQLRKSQARSRRSQVSRLLDAQWSTPELTSQLWPSLAAISCWTDAAAAHHLPQLRREFASVEILAKGLLSTEGCVTVPLVGQPGGAPALRSHFLEFLPAGSDQTKLVHELAFAQRYQVVITTGGGLYRYRTGDWIEVTGHLQSCPLLRFVGRDATTDLVGEKLSDRFVVETLQSMLGKWRAQASFAMLVPDIGRCQYRLFMQTSNQLHQSVSIAEWSVTLDQLLRENPYYRQARELGQLSAPQIIIASSEDNSLQDLYTSIAISHGTRPGSLKPVALETNADRANEFILRWEKNDARKTGQATSR